MGPDELFQRAVIARRYYLEGRTRVEIAEEFGLSRFKIARMLEEAVDSGMVEIKIHDPGSTDVAMSTALQRHYSLQYAYAVAADAKNSTDRVEARATTSLTGNCRWTRTLSISRPTLPVAPITAILYAMRLL